MKIGAYIDSLALIFPKTGLSNTNESNPNPAGLIGSIVPSGFMFATTGSTPTIYDFCPVR